MTRRSQNTVKQTKTSNQVRVRIEFIIIDINIAAL